VVIEAVLQAPAFLFWMDQASRPAWKSYATASRLAYGLWNTMPDDALLDQAERGALDTPEKVATAARAMLQDPRARQGWMSSLPSGCALTARSPLPVNAARSPCSAASW
jgi:hypothetical protein